MKSFWRAYWKEGLLERSLLRGLDGKGAYWKESAYLERA